MTDYTYTNNLNKEQWAWEFLRRNPEYQRDYKQFIHRWNTLEDHFGKESDGDLQAWQNDIRSFANEWDNELTLLEELPGAERDNTSQDPIQIDVWMRKKWGLNSFPVDPKIKSSEIITAVEWYEQKIDLDDIRFDEQTTDPIAQVNFDLRYSLKDQLEAAHKDLITLTGQLQRLGKVKLVAADHYQEWLEQIKLLDDKNLLKRANQKQQLAAKEMCKNGYRKILLMRG